MEPDNHGADGGTERFLTPTQGGDKTDNLDGDERVSARQILLASGLFGIALALLFAFFHSLPVEESQLGIDWRGLWQGLRGGWPSYGTGLRNPPWSLLPLLPLGLLSFRTSWALLAAATIVVELISIPRGRTRRRVWPVALFLVTSYPSIRNIADGNLEVLTMAGVLLALSAHRTDNPWWLAAGALLASAKPQETWLLLVVLAWFVLRSWSRERSLRAFAGATIVVIGTTLLSGKEWLEALLAIEQRGSIMDIGLSSTAARLGLPPLVIGSLWLFILAVTVYFALASGLSMERHKAGMLISASLLLAPYAAGNSLLTVVAIGVVPLFWSRLSLALPMALLVDLPYLAIGRDEIRFAYGAYYAAGLLFIAWLVFVWLVRRNSPSTSEPGRGV